MFFSPSHLPLGNNTFASAKAVSPQSVENNILSVSLWISCKRGVTALLQFLKSPPRRRPHWYKVKNSVTTSHPSDKDNRAVFSSALSLYHVSFIFHDCRFLQSLQRRNYILGGSYFNLWKANEQVAYTDLKLWSWIALLINVFLIGFIIFTLLLNLTITLLLYLRQCIILLKCPYSVVCYIFFKTFFFFHKSVPHK